MRKEHAGYFLKDLENNHGIQDIMFRFIVDGEELEADEHPDLFFDSAMYTPCCNISIEHFD